MRRIYLFLGIAIVVALTANLGFKFYRKMKAMEDERQWYVSQLRYNFTAKIDKILKWIYWRRPIVLHAH